MLKKEKEGSLNPLPPSFGIALNLTQLHCSW